MTIKGGILLKDDINEENERGNGFANRPEHGVGPVANQGAEIGGLI